MPSIRRPRIYGSRAASSSERPVYVVWLADTHCGHTAAVVNPSLEIEHVDLLGQFHVWRPALNPAQQFLWDLYQDCLDLVQRTVGGEELILLHGGDVCHGNKHPDGLMFSLRAWQVDVGLSILNPWFDLFGDQLSTFRIALGTEAHNWGEGSLELLLLDRLKAERPGRDIRPILHGRGLVNGVIVDYAHHGPGPGIREWTDGNQLRYYTRSIIIGDQRRGKEPPDLILRAHFHDFTWESDHYIHGGDVKTTHAFITPSWCAMNFYGQRATKSQANQDFGLLLFKVVGGEIVQVWPFVTFIDLRTNEVWT